jgi:hypothetical protein
MNIAEEKLSLFREIDQLPDDLIIELKNVIAGLRFKKTKPQEMDFSSQEKYQMRALWQEGIESGDSQPLDMQAIRAEALQRYNRMNNENGKII